jgi:Flp pilus assembly protein TadD
MFLRAARALSLVRRTPGLSRALRAALFVALCCAAAHAQGGVDNTGTGGRHIIQGRLVFPSNRRADARLKVRLQSTQSPELSLYTDSNGVFIFNSLNPGTYTVIVEGGDDFETVRESIYIETDINSMVRGVSGPPISRPYTLQVYLQPKSRVGVQASKAGVVNASLSNVPKPALALYNKALEFARNKETWDKAVEQLKAAIALYPDFALAHSELGVLYIMLKQPDKAVEALREAVKLMPDDYATLLTYGRALYDKQRFSEAEEQFRKSLEKNHASPFAHFYLGISLLKRRDYEVAEKELKSAVEFGGDQIPLAHYYLGGIYWGKREYKQAADELETYLHLSPNAEDAARIRATIKDFRSKKQPDEKTEP